MSDLNNKKLGRQGTITHALKVDCLTEDLLRATQAGCGAAWRRGWALVGWGWGSSHTCLWGLNLSTAGYTEWGSDTFLISP